MNGSGLEVRDQPGLTSAEAAARLRRDGPNALPAPTSPSPWRELLGQMVHFFAVVLWIAGALAFVAGLPQLGVAIYVVVVVNGVFAFAQEYRAERAAERLRDLLPRRATVIRDGERVEVDASELVRGDMVSLEAGDHISADLRVDEAHGALVDTSALTGESIPASVESGADLFAGTFLVEGEALGIVTRAGAHTRLAGIAEITRTARRPRTPLALELHRVVRIIATIAVVVAGGFFSLALLLGITPRNGFLFAIGVAVALVPEGLLPTVTLSLAIGAQRMAGRNALVRRLESVETLGSATFICTDKTGTLTRNEMSVVEVWTPAGTAGIDGSGYEPVAEVSVDPGSAKSAVRDLALAAARCSSGRAVQRDGGWVAQGDPMEAAIEALARRVGMDVAAERAGTPDRRRFPFDPRRRRVSTVAGDRLFVKGAPDSVLRCCTGTGGAEAALESMAGRGLRVLAVATRELGDSDPAGTEEAEQNLELLGLLGLEDPPRKGARAAIAACRRAGIRIAMVTGDHPSTAGAIAREVGLLAPEKLVVEGAELPADDQMLGALVDRDGIVISRVTPEDKLRIATALQARGQVVAMTGDGVNDGPALQQADIGIAMGRSGTDVAREASDLVLLDDDFATIVAAVEQGRAAYSNIRRFLTYHLTDNVAELTPFVVWALSGGQFPLAIGVLQVLALDIGTDTFPAVALGAEPPGERALDGPPLRGHLLDRRVAFRVFGLLGPAEALVEMAAFVVALLAAGWRPGDPFPTGGTLLAASGAAFSAVVIGQAANAFACRSTTRPPWSLGWSTNRLLIAAVAFEFALLAAFLFLPALASVLGHAPPSAAGWSIAVLAAPAVLFADAMHKTLRARARARRSDPAVGPGKTRP